MIRFHHLVIAGACLALGWTVLPDPACAADTPASIQGSPGTGRGECAGLRLRRGRKLRPAKFSAHIDAWPASAGTMIELRRSMIQQ
jgi:hypothetical protein